jgi:hypothetical protein
MLSIKVVQGLPAFTVIICKMGVLGPSHEAVIRMKLVFAVLRREPCSFASPLCMVAAVISVALAKALLTQCRYFRF